MTTLVILTTYLAEYNDRILFIDEISFFFPIYAGVSSSINGHFNRDSWIKMHIAQHMFLFIIARHKVK